MREAILQEKLKALQNDYDDLLIKLKKIEKYFSELNIHQVGFWIEDEEGRDTFIDVKQDILDIIKKKE